MNCGDPKLAQLARSVKDTFTALGELNNTISGYTENAKQQTTSAVKRKALDAKAATNIAFAAANRLLSASVAANVAASQNKSEQIHNSAQAMQHEIDGVQQAAEEHLKAAADTNTTALNSYNKSCKNESEMLQNYRSAKASADGVLFGLQRMNSLLNGNLRGALWRESMHGDETFQEGIYAIVEAPSTVFAHPGTASSTAQPNPDYVLETSSEEAAVMGADNIVSEVRSVWFIATKISVASSFDIGQLFHIMGKNGGRD